MSSTRRGGPLTLKQTTLNAVLATLGVCVVWRFNQQKQQMVLILYSIYVLEHQVVDGRIVAVARQGNELQSIA